MKKQTSTKQKSSNGIKHVVSGSVLPAEEMTAAEFFKRINSIPNYTAKNIKMKIQGGWVTIGEMSITTEKVAGKTDR